MEGLAASDVARLAHLFGCGPDELLVRYGHWLDWRPLARKRAEFQRMRARMLAGIVARDGDRCLLVLHEECSRRAEAPDHLIPIATNVLAKARGVQAPVGKKVPARSLGSNHLDNVVASCKRCNGRKKHRLPEPLVLQRILAARRRA